MKKQITLALWVVFLTLSFQPQPTDASETQNSDASIRIHSVRIARSGTELNKRFSGRYYNEGGNAAVNLQLLLTLKDGVILTVPRDAVSLETFVDDTYQNLFSTSGETPYYSGSSQNLLSDDGRTMLITVVGAKNPAEDAGRVFVRGTVKVPISRSKPIVVTNQVSLIVGQEVLVGPFKTTIRSVTSYDQSSGLGVALSIENEPVRIVKVRFLGADGKVLNDERQFRPNTPELADKPLSFNSTLRTTTKDVVTVEFTYVEKSELVHIPFEAQVDIGNSKAGPVGLPGEKKTKEKSSRSWPPPQHEKSAEQLPQRRPPFDPAEQLRTAEGKIAPAIMDNATLDIFSLTVGKPTHSEVKEAKWNSTPSSDMFAAGFTVARLMLTTPGAAILSLPADGLSVTRFEDDKGGKFDTTLYMDASVQTSTPQKWPYVRRSPEGGQVLFNLPLVASPTPGATRCTLAGSVQAKVATGEETGRSKNFSLKTGETFVVGPFSGRLTQVRPIPPLSPARQEGNELEVMLSITGPIANIRNFQFQDNSQKVLNANRINFGEILSDATSNTMLTFRLFATPTGQVTCVITYYKNTELVKVPFDFAVGIGL